MGTLDGGMFGTRASDYDMVMDGKAPERDLVSTADIFISIRRNRSDKPRPSRWRILPIDSMIVHLHMSALGLPGGRIKLLIGKFSVKDALPTRLGMNDS